MQLRKKKRTEKLRIPLLSPREFCPLLFQKALEMMANQNLSTEQMFGGH